MREEAERHVAGERGIKLSSVRTMTQQQLRNITAKTFGVKLATDDEGRQFVISNLIMVGTEVPREASQKAMTIQDGQTVVELECMESTSPEAQCPVDEGTQIGEAISVEFGRPLPQHTPIDIHFELTPDGLLSVAATEGITGAMGKGTIKTGAISSEEELEKRKAVTRTMAIS